MNLIIIFKIIIFLFFNNLITTKKLNKIKINELNNFGLSDGMIKQPCKIFPLKFKNINLTYYCIENDKKQSCKPNTKLLIIIPIRRNSFNERDNIRKSYLIDKINGTEARFFISDPEELIGTMIWLKIYKYNFKCPFYPPYMSGPSYLLTKAAILKIVKYSSYVKAIHIEDVLFTGIIAKKAKIARSGHWNMFNTFEYTENNECENCIPLLITTIGNYDINKRYEELNNINCSKQNKIVISQVLEILINKNIPIFN
ncbi:hypothetical protein Mgra_00006390 [Meloidogyne graminicola]|uniref:Hexosyltransferase n=1 Tax=Meloidogyne graminicola TaxID=189291 RepID=A0A8S9ZLM9_9BILA|nr:hypothetical protein Mgra_00006390 [Meloidogyne graminicola]